MLPLIVSRVFRLSSKDLDGFDVGGKI